MDFKKILRFVLIVAVVTLVLIMIRAVMISLYKVSTILAFIIMAVAIVIIYDFIRSKIKKK